MSMSFQLTWFGCCAFRIGSDWHLPLPSSVGLRWTSFKAGSSSCRWIIHQLGTLSAARIDGSMWRHRFKRGWRLDRVHWQLFRWPWQLDSRVTRPSLVPTWGKELGTLRRSPLETSSVLFTLNCLVLLYVSLIVGSLWCTWLCCFLAFPAYVCFYGFDNFV